MIFDSAELRDRKKSFRNFFKIMPPTVLHTPGPHESIAPNSDSKVEREHAFRSVFRFWSIYSPMGTKIEKRFEKRVPVRISCRTKARSIPEGLGLKMALGAKLKKNYENFFYDPLNKMRFNLIN